MSDLRTCVTCRHRRDNGPDLSLSLCGLALVIDPVTGESRYRFCATERAPFTGWQMCGAGGGLWEPKQAAEGMR
jgi:hypothetical protein